MFGTTEATPGTKGNNCPLCGQAREVRTVTMPRGGWGGSGSTQTQAEVCVNPKCSLCVKN